MEENNEEKLTNEIIYQRTNSLYARKITMEVIYILKRLIERFREKKRVLHMVFINLGKANERILREVKSDMF